MGAKKDGKAAGVNRPDSGKSLRYRRENDGAGVT